MFIIRTGHVPFPLGDKTRGAILGLIARLIATYPNPLAPGETALLTTMINSQIDSGNWNKLNSLVFMNLADATNSLWDVKRGNSTTAVNDPTHTAGVGYASNGTTQYINSNIAPDEIGSQNNNFAGIFLVSGGGFAVNNRSLLSSEVTSSVITGIIERTSGYRYWSNDSETDQYTTAINTNTLLITQRLDATDKDFLLDGNIVRTDPATSISPSSFNIVLSARNVSDTISSFCPSTISSFVAGEAVGFNHSDYFSELTIFNTGIANL